MNDADLTLFAHVVTRPEDELDLAQAALVIAEREYPGLDVGAYLQKLDELGQGARERVAKAGLPERTLDMPTPSVDELRHRLQPILAFVYEELGFRGNRADYYDPRNSFLNEVLDRRTGIPITLAIVLVEVCRRAGLDARGVCFPGHFLVRLESTRGPLMVDPFDGRPLGRSTDLDLLYARVTGRLGKPEETHLAPSSKRDILLRLLQNLRGIYSSQGDQGRLRDVLQRVQILAPSKEVEEELRGLQDLSVN